MDKCNSAGMCDYKERGSICSYEGQCRGKDKIIKCGWCNKGYRFEFNWINEDGNNIVTKDNMVISGVADFCPACGMKLNN